MACNDSNAPKYMTRQSRLYITTTILLRNYD